MLRIMEGKWSNGVIHDFAGPYTVTVDDLAFGETHKYVQLKINDAAKYDQAVLKADCIYMKMMHNLFWYNKMLTEYFL